MADDSIRISELEQITDLKDNDTVLAVDSTESDPNKNTKQVAAKNVKSYVNAYTRQETDAKLDLKISVETGKSLIADTEISRLATLSNFDNAENESRLMAIETKNNQQDAEIANKQNKLVAGTNITIVGDTINADSESPGGGIEEAPTDGKKYARQDAAWSEVVDVDVSELEWGNITGDIKNQSDLKSQFDEIESSIANIEVGEIRDFVENPISLTSEVVGILPIENVNTDSLFSGDYNELSNKPNIPENISALNNDSNFITLNDIPKQIQNFNVMFFARKDNRTVITHDVSTETQIILPSTWFPSNPSQWHDILTIEADESVEDAELEFVTGSKFAAKIWVKSAMTRNNAQFRISAIDKTDGAILASATTIVNLPNNTPSPIPVAFENIHQEIRIVKLKDIQIVISINTSEYSTQIEVISDTPNEICYIVHNSVINKKGRDFSENPINLETEAIGAISSDSVKFSDGKTFQEKYDNGELKGEDGKSFVVSFSIEDGILY